MHQPPCKVDCLPLQPRLPHELVHPFPRLSLLGKWCLICAVIEALAGRLSTAGGCCCCLGCLCSLDGMCACWRWLHPWCTIDGSRCAGCPCCVVARTPPSYHPLPVLLELCLPALIPCHHSTGWHSCLPPTAWPSPLPWHILPFACLDQAQVEETAPGCPDGEVGERHVIPDGPHVGVEGGLCPWCQEEGLVVRAV
jgi:hypothetical protein